MPDVGANRDPVRAIYDEAHALAASQGIDPRLLPREDARNTEDGLWIEPFGIGLFERLYMERGERITLGRDDAAHTLFEAMLSATAAEAGRREAKQRIPGQDSRRQWMATQRVMMASMKPEWEALTAAHHAEILARAPYRDE